MVEKAEVLRRPWHGASDRAEDPSVAALRLQRAEVDALIAFRAAPEGSEEAAAIWQRLARLREERLALLNVEARQGLPALPPAPQRNLSGWQKLVQRFKNR
jgi:hypothetical protein